MSEAQWGVKIIEDVGRIVKKIIYDEKLTVEEKSEVIMLISLGGIACLKILRTGDLTATGRRFEGKKNDTRKRRETPC